MSDELGKWGDRVQRSVFEIVLSSDQELQRLRRKLHVLLTEAAEAEDPEFLEIRFYKLCRSCQQQSFVEGEGRIPIASRPVVIVA